MTVTVESERLKLSLEETGTIERPWSGALFWTCMWPQDEAGLLEFSNTPMVQAPKYNYENVAGSLSKPPFWLSLSQFLRAQGQVRYGTR